MRATASATTDIQRSPSRAPSAKLTSAGAGGSSTTASTGAAMLSRPIVVSQVVSPRRPITTSGTTSTESPGSSANAKEPKLTRPVPGSLTSSRTTVRSVVSAHHFTASQPGDGPIAGQQLDQRGDLVEVEADGAGDEGADGRRLLVGGRAARHGGQPTPETHV